MHEWGKKGVKNQNGLLAQQKEEKELEKID